ncbi:nucleotidyltransferase family protein [Piscinibacter sp.]|uniref:nucleotidyltransferase family protein n=1 Tax=Piscinibacter sp. TaxID=1903157 RepID=UPI002C54B20A|nr:nucleotidyltransferase family protein [Albitalea sp.]HUG22382.1 nucleotidyltransferase family protein [Albitalea sp.]
MLPDIEFHRAQLDGLCRRMGVQRLEVFGSAARDDFDQASSDIDFLVEFVPDPGRSALEVYFGLKDELEALFSRPVDLVMPAAVRNPYIRAEIDRERQVVYAARHPRSH